MQQVVLGGGATSAKWNVTLEGNGITPLAFSASSPNQAGYVVFTIEIPKDLPLGAYSVSTSAPGSPKTVVAGVALVEVQTKTATNSLVDLSQIIAILVFLTVFFSTLRSQKYHVMAFPISQTIRDEQVVSDEKSFGARLQESPHRIRIRVLENLPPSLLSYLIVREGEVLYRASRQLYSLLPLIGIVVGAIAGIEVQRNDGLAKTGLGIFIALTLIAVLDNFSGIFALASFWAIELFLGNVSSVRDLLVIFATGLSILGPSLIATLARHGIARDVEKVRAKGVVGLFAAFIGCAIGGMIFYLGNLLGSSMLYVNTSARDVQVQQILVVSGAIFLKKVYEQAFYEKLTNETYDFKVARVSSPLVALIINFVIFGFVYVWTQSSVRALEVSILFSVPFYLVFIKLSSVRWAPKLPRSILLEPIFMASIAFILFQRVSQRPLLNDQMAILLLILTAIPGIIHAGYSIICSSSEEREIMKV